MVAPSWLSFGRQHADRPRVGRKTRTAESKKIVPRLERLEQISLLSTVQTITEPPLVISNVLTNFGPPSAIPVKALAPPLPLFNPQLGTLVSVTVTSTTNLTSNIQSENTSVVSGASITAQVSGQTELDLGGLNSFLVPIRSSLAQSVGPIDVQPFVSGSPIDFSPPSGVSFVGASAPSATNTQTTTYSDPSSLAFFTSSLRRSTIPVVFSANANASATSPNGNLTTRVQTPASATVSVSYNFTPPCPMPTNIVRFGIHRQQTQLVVHFNGPVGAVDAQNPAHYTITNSAGAVIPVVSATVNTTNNTVTLIPAQRLNSHFHFLLSVNLPCYNGVPTILSFGGRASLGGGSLGRTV